MKAIENQTFGVGTTVIVDDSIFVNCKFEGCGVIFGGGEFTFKDCSWKNVKLHFVGPAQRTLKLMGIVGMIKKEDIPKQLTDTLQ